MGKTVEGVFTARAVEDKRRRERARKRSEGVGMTFGLVERVARMRGAEQEGEMERNKRERRTDQLDAKRESMYACDHLERKRLAYLAAMLSTIERPSTFPLASEPSLPNITSLHPTDRFLPFALPTSSLPDLLATVAPDLLRDWARDALAFMARIRADVSRIAARKRFGADLTAGGEGVGCRGGGV
jgi:hypothetical protein